MKSISPLILLLWLVPFCHAEIITVPGDKATIQAGIDAAVPSDTVLVAAGVYEEHLVIDGDNAGMHLLGSCGSLTTPADTTDDTIVDGTESGRPLTMDFVDDVRIEGFTFTRGTGENLGGNIYCSNTCNRIAIMKNVINYGKTTGWGGYGGGLFIAASRSLVKWNVIRDNQAWANGGGLTSNGFDITIESNLICDNQADYAGGIKSEGAPVYILNNLIDNNYADFRHGGGLNVAATGDVQISNNTIVNNRAIDWGFGGGIYIEASGSARIDIFNNILVANDNGDGTGGLHCQVFPGSSVTLDVHHNTLFDNSGAAYYGCAPGIGAISTDPEFVNPTDRDYHLTYGSPSIDGGYQNGELKLPRSDFDNNVRIHDGDGDGSAVIDMGAFEYGALELPVQIESFRARTIAEGIELTWKTLCESNNYGFEIQRRSAVGSFKKIGFVQGRGSTGIAHEYRYVDRTTAARSVLFYRLRQIDLNGAFVFTGTIQVSAVVPGRFVLFPNYPNPFNARTRIRYTLPDDAAVLIRLYDVRGERVTTLIDSFQSAGEHSVLWQAESVPAGIYFLKIDAGAYSAVNKCLLIN